MFRPVPLRIFSSKCLRVSPANCNFVAKCHPTTKETVANSDSSDVGWTIDRQQMWIKHRKIIFLLFILGTFYFLSRSLEIFILDSLSIPRLLRNFANKNSCITVFQFYIRFDCYKCVETEIQFPRWIQRRYKIGRNWSFAVRVKNNFYVFYRGGAIFANWPEKGTRFNRE